MPEPRLDYPATVRNREAILAALRGLLSEEARVLEIGSGSGQHAAYIAEQWPGLRWMPSDVGEETFASIRSWTRGLANVAVPRLLDAEHGHGWPREVDAIFSANVVHIAPWSVCLGILTGAGRVLPAGGPLILYGPFRIPGRPTAPSNEAFDADLRGRDPRWGVRDLGEIAEEARSRQLLLDRVVEMPANNHIAVFRHK